MSAREGELQPVKSEDQDRSFDVVKVKYINLDSIRSVIFTKLESSISHR